MRNFNMNTPEPCDSCGFNYYDVMAQDDPDSSFECLKHLPIDPLCTGYKNWKELSEGEKWRDYPYPEYPEGMEGMEECCIPNPRRIK
jgi:hypothetical protein